MAKFSGIACDGCGKPITDTVAQYRILEKLPEKEETAWLNGQTKPVLIDACTVACLRKATVKIENQAREVAKKAKEAEKNKS